MRFEGEHVLVAVHEELLHADFSEREEEFRPCAVLGDFPEAVGGEQYGGEELGGGIEAVVEGLVEGFDEEGNFWLKRLW